ncbi:hypothetical protein [Streptomyces sp. NPDC058861]|uniref:hypothetical protein n=1 Tax=Streptomyces sp. NPDC058861 TaxID=3346653 RepID=UPI003681D970
MDVFATDPRGSRHGWNVRDGWSGWHGMNAPAPGPARALAVGSPAPYRQHL